ncbi:acyltransferase [Pectobacterium versatile]|uniref:acyltransferase n=1 Tax=Pectobacterium versatile TaxID=2488639 RepID=UPI001F221C20|nr:acyltransferase [Pectobacterium versatile]
MHQFLKLIWIIRAVLYKPFFAKFNFPSYMGSPIFLMNARNIYLGKWVRIFPGLRAECHGKGRLFIHDNVSIGQGFHVIASEDLYIKSGCLISGNVFITDTDHTYTDISCPVFEQPNIIKKTEVGENCFIGIGARIQAGTILGKGCVVGANAVVRGTFPDYSVIVGAPARVVKRFNHDTSTWERVDP